MPIDDEPFTTLRHLQSEMDRLFVDLFGRRPTSPKTSFTPLADVYQQKGVDKTVVKMELPGIKLEELNITIEGRSLLVQGVRHDPKCKDKIYHQIEIDRGPFERMIVLPHEVDASSARATYKDGFLFIELPLPKTEKKAVKIPIKVKED